MTTDRKAQAAWIPVSALIFNQQYFVQINHMASLSHTHSLDEYGVAANLPDILLGLAT